MVLLKPSKSLTVIVYTIELDDAQVEIGQTEQ